MNKTTFSWMETSRYFVQKNAWFMAVFTHIHVQQHIKNHEFVSHVFVTLVCK